MKSGKSSSQSIIPKVSGAALAISTKKVPQQFRNRDHPDAMLLRALDKERKEKECEGPLHGIPILIKTYRTAEPDDYNRTDRSSVGSRLEKDSFVTEGFVKQE